MRWILITAALSLPMVATAAPPILPPAPHQPERAPTETRTPGKLVNASTDAPVPTIPSVIPADLTMAMQAVEADKAMVSSGTASVNAATAALNDAVARYTATLNKAKTDLNTANATLAEDCDKERELHDKYYPPKPQPGPKPPPGPGPVDPPVNAPTVSLLVIGSANCQPCVEMYPIVDALRAGGTNISRLDNNELMAQKYGVAITPTTIVLVDGNEVQRYAGKLSKAALVDWQQKAQEWAKRKWPTTERMPPLLNLNAVERY